MGGEDNPIPINAVYINQYKKSAKNPANTGILTPPASIVEESINQSEHNTQHMEKAVTCVAKLIIFTVCFRGKPVTKSSRPIAAAHEIPSEPCNTHLAQHLYRRELQPVQKL